MLDIIGASVHVISYIIILFLLIVVGQLWFFENWRMIAPSNRNVADKKGLCNWVGLWLFCIAVVTGLLLLLFRINSRALMLWLIGWTILVTVAIIKMIKGSKRYLVEK